MDKYAGYVALSEASVAGVVPPEMDYPGMICLRCGAVVGGINLHNDWHRGQDEIVDYCRRLGQATFGDTPMS